MSLVSSKIPELPEVGLELPQLGIRLTTWSSYHYNSNFLTPTDGWSFTVGGDDVPSFVANLLSPGERVSLWVDGHVQGDGYIDDVEVHSDRESGTTATISGRDRLAYAVDSGIDPKTKFAKSDTLLKFLIQVFAPFGWTDESQFDIDDDTNRNVITGRKRATPVSSKKRKPLKSYVTHELKPYPNEGAFAFAARVSQRFGLWIWPSAQGDTLIVGKPTFDSEPIYKLVRKAGNNRFENNILRGTVRQSVQDQPSVIIAAATVGDSDYSKAHLVRYIVNPAIDVPGTDLVLLALTAYPVAVQVFPSFKFPKYENKFARPMYLYDDESKTGEQLEAFTRRELALRLRKSLTCHYTVEGHTNSGAPWCVNAVVDVDDDIGGVHEKMWILSRTFEKSRSGGTFTHLELIRLGSLEF